MVWRTPRKQITAHGVSGSFFFSVQRFGGKVPRIIPRLHFLFFFLPKVEISSCAPIWLFRPGISPQWLKKLKWLWTSISWLGCLWGCFQSKFSHCAWTAQSIHSNSVAHITSKQYFFFLFQVCLLNRETKSLTMYRISSPHPHPLPFFQADGGLTKNCIPKFSIPCRSTKQKIST